MKHKKIIVYILTFFLVLTTVLAAGICGLDQFMYHPGETATISCTCTLGNEKNVAGNFIWRNGSNDVIQNTTTNSNDCVMSIFGDSFIFPSDANYTGNVTFDTLSTSWAGGDDIVTDDFNVSGAHILDCIIVNIGASNKIILGEVASVKFEVQDARTFDPLVHMTCNVEGLDIDRVPLIFEPAIEDFNNFRYTSAEGHIGFSHEMTESFWEINTAYVFEFHCFSLPSSGSEHDLHTAYDEVNGTAIGFKSCTAELIFNTNNIDLRTTQYDNSLLAVIVALFIIILYFFIMGIFTKGEGLLFLSARMFSFGIATLETLILTGVLYANYAHINITELLRINFMIMFVMGILMGLGAIILFMIKMINPQQDINKEQFKWER